MSSISVAKHTKKPNAQELVFFQRNKSLTGFVKCTSCVNYASRVKCAAAREGIYFISHCDIVAEQQGAQYFTISARKLFTCNLTDFMLY